MTLSPLLVRPTTKTGKIHDVTPASAGWTHVGFALHRLAPGEAYGEATEDREVCLVLVSGKGRFAVDGEDFGELGERMSLFEGTPYALYVPAGRHWAVRLFRLTARRKAQRFLSHWPSSRPMKLVSRFCSGS